MSPYYRILEGAQVRYNIGYYKGLKCAVILNVTGDGVGSSVTRIDPGFSQDLARIEQDRSLVIPGTNPGSIPDSRILAELDPQHPLDK
jgi:hypothetical protein